MSSDIEELTGLMVREDRATFARWKPIAAAISPHSGLSTYSETETVVVESPVAPANDIGAIP
ncbi:hypothetical protein G5V57_23245 [Nordella sp. HKS 07]|uniref:hypothetical protein n=1 Tax=Nordella sp. HKS 07 TaxID=2712222 RepID=UPI0013E1AFC4|nr:hypothetical protein [Nordella sp. HKS 07]QIG50388.1 hypothetical protein G5V57_23245 [Nordella sp. HKS 07]